MVRTEEDKEIIRQGKGRLNFADSTHKKMGPMGAVFASAVGSPGLFFHWPHQPGGQY